MRIRNGVLILVFFLIAAVYILATFGVALTKAPFCDEGWLASPGLNLIRHGTFETSVIEPAGSWLRSIDRYTYWVMPLWLLATALWYKLFGFGLTTLRSLSAFWGVLGLAACFCITRRLSGQRTVALLSCAILAVDTNFVLNGATGRMDMMSAMAGAIGLAIYLCLREAHFARAVFLSHTFVAIGIFSHPNGVIAFLCLCFLTLYLDRRHIRWADAFLALTPYLAGLAAWGLYIRHDSQAFAAQFFGNAKAQTRLLVIHSPLAALKLELMTRYLDGYGFYADGWKKLRALPLLLYAAAFLGSLFVRVIRRDRYLRAALWLAFLSCICLFFIDGLKRSFYLVHVLLPIAIVLAVWLSWVWQRWPRAHMAVICAVLTISSVQLAGVFTLIRSRNRQRSFDPVIAFLQQRRTPDAVIMGPSELGFGLGYNPPLVDDFRLGFYSGKRARFIVVDDNYRSFFQWLAQNEQPVYRYVQMSLDRDYQPVYRNGMYVVFARR
jgi:4-amino-4-deoxy-L-arabinose transferase-like glycosyltransferase